MTRVFDRIVIAVPDLSTAIDQYRGLLGIAPREFQYARPRESAAWWGLSNTVIELVQHSLARPRIQGIVLNLPEAGQGEAPVANPLGLDIRIGAGRRTTAFRTRQHAAQCEGLAVDHLVLRTDDAQACIDLFAGKLGIRLALDKTVPEWGGRMLFFRAGKLTLEAIQSDTDETGGNYFDGIAYQCRDLGRVAQELLGRGVALSDVREGRKPGTLVATLQSHCLGIPTLLIQPAT